MKGLSFRIILTLLIATLPLCSHAKMSRDSVRYVVKKKVSKLIPRTFAAQYAGSIGTVSAGLEWNFGKRDQWGVSILVGYLSAFDSGREKVTMTLKHRYTPWEFHINERLTLRPLDCGIFINSIFSHQFWSQEPDKYPEGYYGFATRIRMNIFTGSTLRINIPERYSRAIKTVDLYYELSTSDLKVCSYFPNMDYLKLKDMFSLGFGMKLNF